MEKHRWKKLNSEIKILIKIVGELSPNSRKWLKKHLEHTGNTKNNNKNNWKIIFGNLDNRKNTWKISWKLRK